LEHLIASSRGAPDTMENLVLCHPPCNRELGDVPLAEKIKAREIWKEAVALVKHIGKLLLG
jgi:5-methylcytosine-specific restriction endonuclease McrA